MFYEAKNSHRGEQLKIETGRNFNFPSHLHSSFEMITVLDGEMAVTIDKKQYILTAGRAVLVFPNQVHSLQTSRTSRHLLCIFSTQLVRAYSSVHVSRIPVDHTFLLAPFYVQQLQQLKEEANTLQAKGCLYGICAAFDKGREYADRKDAGEDLLGRIFRFVEEHYMGACSLQDLAENTSYHKVYLSRYFKQCTGLGFTDHVNRYRINEAAYMLKNTDEKMLQIAYSCGFDSLRSFNRNFRTIMGITPNQYRTGN